MIKKVFIFIVASLFFNKINAQINMTLDSVIGNLYSTYKVGSDLKGFLKKDGDIYVQLGLMSSREMKFWDHKSQTFSKLGLRKNYNNSRNKENIKSAKYRWYGLSFIFDSFNNFGYEGYYNDEIKQRKAENYKASYALLFSYAQKAENKFIQVYNGVELERFDFEKQPKMSKSQEKEVRLLVDKVISLADKADGYAKTDYEKERISAFLAGFKAKMFLMFEVHAKKMNPKEWLSIGLYSNDAIIHAKNKLTGVKPGDVIFCDRNYGAMLFVQYHSKIAKGAHIVPDELLKSKYFLSDILRKIGVEKDPDWFLEFNNLQPITSIKPSSTYSNSGNEQGLEEAFRLSASGLKNKMKTSYTFNYKNTAIYFSNSSRIPIRPSILFQYYIIENVKEGNVYWSGKKYSIINNYLMLDGLLYKLSTTRANNQNVSGVDGYSSYNKIVNEFDLNIKTMSNYYKNQYFDLYAKTIKELAKDGDLEKAQELYIQKEKTFEKNNEAKLQSLLKESELALALNLPKYALEKIKFICEKLEPGVYNYPRGRNQIVSRVWEISSFAKKYDCLEISDVLNEAKIYTTNTVKFTSLEGGKSQLSTLTGQPVSDVKYDSIRKVNANHCIVKNGDEWYIIDISGKTVTNQKYLSVEGTGKYFKVQSKQGVGLISSSFKELIPNKFSSIDRSRVQNYSNNSRYFVTENNGEFGIMEVNQFHATEILPCEFSSIEVESLNYQDFFKCSKPNESFYITNKGKRINRITELEEEEDEIVEVDMGPMVEMERDEKAANVGTHIIKENGLSGIVYIRRNSGYGSSEKYKTDTIPCMYDTIVARDSYYDWFFAKKDGLWGVVNIKNEILMPFKYKEIGRRQLKVNGKKGNPVSYVAVKNKAWGVFACDGNSQTSWNLGKEVCELKYDSISYNSKAGYLIMKDGKLGVLSTVFPNKTIPPIYKKYMGVNTNFIQPIYTFIDENDKEIRVYSGGEVVE